MTNPCCGSSAHFASSSRSTNSYSQARRIEATPTLVEGVHEDIYSELTPLLHVPELTTIASSLTAAMEKVKESKAARFMDKLAVDSEPGLTTAQLMLANHDLKPVEPARRQWRGVFGS